MNKFYIYSLLIFTLILGRVFKINDEQKNDLLKEEKVVLEPLQKEELEQKKEM